MLLQFYFTLPALGRPISLRSCLCCRPFARSLTRRPFLAFRSRILLLLVSFPRFVRFVPQFYSQFLRSNSASRLSRCKKIIRVSDCFLVVKLSFCCAGVLPL